MSNDTTDSKALVHIFKGQEVRVIVIEGEPWFVAKDVASVLDHSNPSVLLKSLDDDEKGVSNVYTLGGEQEMAIINRSGLYHAILKSRKPQAQLFRKWVTAELLPSIEQTGAYALPGKESALALTEYRKNVNSFFSSISRIKGVTPEYRPAAHEVLRGFASRLGYQLPSIDELEAEQLPLDTLRRNILGLNLLVSSLDMAESEGEKKALTNLISKGVAEISTDIRGGVYGAWKAELEA